MNTNNRERICKMLREHPDWSLRRIAKELNLHHSTVNKFGKRIRGGAPICQSVPEPGPGKETEEGMKSDLGDTAGNVTSTSRTIRTQEELLEAAKIDLNVWKVTRTIINKWEVVMREPATTVGGRGNEAMIAQNDEGGSQRTLWTRGSHEPMHEEMFQVKVVLERKTPPEHAVSSLLKHLESRARNSPLFPHIRRERLHREEGKQSLEIDIMDPHIGLFCNWPEADAPWDLDMSCNMVMSAAEDLIEKASKHGKFEEVFIPFGNDWVHSDNVFHTTTAGTGQPEAVDWHAVFVRAEELAFLLMERLRQVAPLHVYEIPGNHSRQTDFALGRILKAGYAGNKDVTIHADSSPYKFHRAGKNLIGFEHGHSVSQVRLAALMANERKNDWAETEYREWHLGDQHRKGSSKPSMLEEQGVSIEYVPGLTAPNCWHRLKSFSHQQRGAMGYIWDWNAGPVARFQFNISKYTHKILKRK